MSIHDRIKLVVKWLIGAGVSNNQENIGRLIGYTNKSSFSQILNNKVPIPEGFIEKLCHLNQNINKVWIETEKGFMLHSDQAQLSSPTPGTDKGNLIDDSIIYRMYKDQLQAAKDEQDRKDMQLREERTAKEALIKENGRLEERVRTLESKLQEYEPSPELPKGKIKGLSSSETAKPANIKKHIPGSEHTFDPINLQTENL